MTRRVRSLPFVAMCRMLAFPFVVGGLLAGSAAIADSHEAAPGYRGEQCAVTCGVFKDDTCEVWDEAGDPSCQCVRGSDLGAYTQCRCADGSKPEGCRCSNAPHDLCDPDNPDDDCESCRCQC